MYKIFIRPIGSINIPTSMSYEVLQLPDSPDTDVKVIFDGVVPNISQYVTAASLEMSSGAAGSCTFTISEGHPFYSSVVPYATEVLVYEGDTCIWLGRVIDIAKDRLLNLSVTAEGAYATLNDIYVTANNDSQRIPRAWEVWDVIDEYVSPVLVTYNVPSVKRDKILYIDYIESYFDPEHPLEIYLEDGFDYYSVKEVLEKIVEKYGGVFYIEPGPMLNNGDPIEGTLCAHLKYSTTTPTKLISTQNHVNFIANALVNVSDISQDYNIDEFATAIYPLGGLITDTAPLQGVALERYDIHEATSIPSGFTRVTDSGDPRRSYLYNASAVSQFGWIEKVCKYDDLTVPNDIVAEAAKDLALMLMQTVETSIKFNALVNSEPTPRNSSGTITPLPRLYDGVKIVAPFNGINLSTPVQILDISINILKPYESNISLSITDYKRITKLI